MTKEEKEILDKKQRISLIAYNKDKLIDIILSLTNENRKYKEQTFEDKIREIIMEEVRDDPHGFIRDRIDRVIDGNKDYY